MKQLFMVIKDRFLSGSLDLRVRLFNVLAMAGVLISLVMAVSALFSRVGMGTLLLNVLAAGLSYGLLAYSYRTGKYQLCYMITIIAVFMGLFPALFSVRGAITAGCRLSLCLR